MLYSFLQELEETNAALFEDERYYTTNPLGIFAVHKRLAQEWGAILGALKLHPAYVRELAKKIESLEKSLPGEKDMMGVGRSVIQLQRIYNLSTADMAEGKVPKNSQPIGLDICVELAEIAIDIDQPFYALQWYEQATKICDQINRSEDPKTGKLCLRAKSKLAAFYYKVSWCWV